MALTLRFDPGPAARFGPVRMTGAETVDPTFVLRRLPWRFGDTADVRAVETGRQALAAPAVSDTSGVQFADALGSDGFLPVLFISRRLAHPPLCSCSPPHPPPRPPPLP